MRRTISDPTLPVANWATRSARFDTIVPLSIHEPVGVRRPGHRTADLDTCPEICLEDCPPAAGRVHPLVMAGTGGF